MKMRVEPSKSYGACDWHSRATGSSPATWDGGFERNVIISEVFVRFSLEQQEKIRSDFGLGPGTENVGVAGYAAVWTHPFPPPTPNSRPHAHTYPLPPPPHALALPV